MGDEIEDVSLVDLVEGAAGLADVDIDIGLEGFDDAPTRYVFLLVFIGKC